MDLHRPCPACGGTDRFYLITDPHDGGDPYWRCRVCDFTESHDDATLDTAAPDHVSRQQPRTPAQIAESHYAYTAVAERCAQALWWRGGAEALAYLRKRGLHDATIRAAKLGWSGDGYRFFTDLFYSDRAAYDGAMTGGLRKAQGVPRPVLKGCITIPYWDGETCVLLRGRKLSPKRGEAKYLSPAGPLYAGATPRFYLHDTLTADAPVILTEGEIKALAAFQMYLEGDSALPCVATCGILYLPPPLVETLRGRIVYLAYDSEEPKRGYKQSPGELAIARNGAKLRTVNAIVKVTALPRPGGVTKVDLDSYLLAA